VGIKFNKLSLTEEGTLDATPVTGYVFYCPITTDVFTYPIFVQRVDYHPFNVNTKDAAIFEMDPTMAYYLNRDKATDVFFKYRRSLTDIEAGYMRTVIYDAYRVVANNYTSDELMANRASFEREVRIMLDSTLTSEGFVVTEFTSQITPPESLRQMIDAKNAAVQAALKAENEVKQAARNTPAGKNSSGIIRRVRATVASTAPIDFVEAAKAPAKTKIHIISIILGSVAPRE
jgi:regulator of protease activity HflC (stomatin/prohibitin superfamily)